MRLRVLVSPGRYKYVEVLNGVVQLPCRFRGARLGAEPCGGCGSKVNMTDVFACTMHEECSLNVMTKRLGVQCCAGCKERKE